MKAKIAIFLLLASVSGLATSGTILQATRRLRMSSSEALPQKDFYVGLGARDGVRVGDTFSVRRAISMSNGQSDANIHLIHVPLGELRVLAVGDTASIARVENVVESSLLPAFQYPGFMVGDEVLAKSGLPAGSTVP